MIVSLMILNYKIYMVSGFCSVVDVTSHKGLKINCDYRYSIYSVRKTFEECSKNVLFNFKVFRQIKIYYLTVPEKKLKKNMNLSNIDKIV